MEKRLIDEADVKRVLRAVKRNRMVCINRETEIALKVAEGGLLGCKTLSLNTLRDAIYQDAVAHGLWEAGNAYPLDDCCELINDELKELAEAADDYEYKGGDFKNVVEELADIVIISMSIAGLHSIDIDTAIRRKMAINHNRSWKHEGEHREEPHDPR